MMYCGVPRVQKCMLLAVIAHRRIDAVADVRTWLVCGVSGASAIISANRFWRYRRFFFSLYHLLFELVIVFDMPML